MNKNLGIKSFFKSEKDYKTYCDNFKFEFHYVNTKETEKKYQENLKKLCNLD
jgi:hypothetical protein